MKIDRIVDENNSIINYWKIDSEYTPWWISEISIDPENNKISWINIGYVRLLSTENNSLEYILAISANNYCYKFN